MTNSPTSPSSPSPARQSPLQQTALTPSPSAASAHRELYWQNVIREMLSALAVAAAQSGGRLGPTAKSAANGAAPIDDMFDGRLSVITRLGQRIAIADVFPLFACSLPNQSSSKADQHLAMDVQCTVFQIRTPDGEVFTLPVHEIVSFHSLSDQLIRRLEEAARQQALEGSDPASASRPFGFAAFTSLARSAEEQTDSESGS